MTCDELILRLDDYVEETLPPADRAAIAEHLLGCPTCRAEAETLATLLRETRALPREVMPEEDLWTGIAARLAPTTRRQPGSATGWRWPLRAAAALALLSAGAALGAYYSRGPDSDFRREQARYAAASAELADALARDPGRISPAGQAVVERNLAILDAAIREAEAALAADPGNPALEQMLVARYQQRLDLLRRAAATGRQVS